MADNWYYAQGQQRVGPMSLDELKQRLPGIGGAEALVYGPGMQNWSRAGDVAALYAAATAGYAMAPAGGPPPVGGGGGFGGGGGYGGDRGDRGDRGGYGGPRGPRRDEAPAEGAAAGGDDR